MIICEIDVLGRCFLFLVMGIRSSQVMRDEEDESGPCDGDEPTDDPERGFAVFVADIIVEREHAEYAP